jgi:hypothetical protein
VGNGPRRKQSGIVGAEALGRKKQEAVVHSDSAKAFSFSSN